MTDMSERGTHQRAESGDSQSERMLTTVGGGLLTLWAIRRGGLFASVAAMAGAAMLARSMGRNLGEAGSLRGMLERVSGRMSRNREAESNYAARRGWSDAVLVTEKCHINRPRIEVYRFWRNFENLGRFMPHIDHVDVIDDRRSHWTVKAPAGQRVTWDAVVTDDRPGERIAWSSGETADVRNEGWVEFKESGEGTEVKAFIAYEPPAGQFGRIVARIFGEEPSVQARDGLTRLKELLEGSEALATPQAEAGRKEGVAAKG